MFLKVREMTDNLVKFVPGMDLKPKRRGGYFCNHGHVNIVQKCRHVECRHCGQVIDAFDFLWQFCTKEDRLNTSVKSLKQQIMALNAELGELKRDERNTRARLKRLRSNA